MKKLLCVIAVIALAAPVMAADGDPNVAVTCSDLGSGLVEVSYQVLVEDVDPGLMRGIALDITTSNAATIDGISAFAISPGFVRTAMTEGVAGSPEDEKWYGGMFRRRLSEGHDVPPERAADLVLTLASGRADALSGCFIRINHDVDEMVARAEEIQQEGAYTLRLRI